MGQPKVIMPQVDYGNRQAQDYRNRELVPKYGEATVLQAEVTACIQLLFMVGIIKPTEFIDMVGRICFKIDSRRRESAKLDEDKG